MMSSKNVGYVDKLFTYIEKNRSKFQDTLKNERKPISGAGEGVQQRALDWVSEKLRSAGAAVEPCEVSAKSPSVIRAVLGKARDKKTLLIYGHLNPPPRGKEIVLFGNGITDSRGSLISLFAAIDVYKNVKIPLPVNLRFLFESMTEKNADDFINYLYKNSAAIFAGVDHVCVLDNRPNYFYGAKPLICWGLRGCCEFELTVECASKNLNSGENGGAIQEAMTDLIVLLSCLVNSKGDILIPGINEDVTPITPQEEKDYHKATFDVDRYKTLTGAHMLLHKEEKKRVLLHMTRFPSLSIHSIRSQTESNDESIPSSATGKFSIRIVPDQTVNSVQENVIDYLTRMMSVINSSNKMSIKLTNSSPPWITDPKDANIQACIRALKRVYKDEPELIREGLSIPILTELQKNSGKDVLLFPVGRIKCHTPRNTDENVFFDTTRSLCSYFYELSR